MVLEKFIVILMKIQTNAGFCIAGKEIIGTKIGDWIRPVKGNNQFEEGQSLELLDLVKICLDGNKLDQNQPYQTENYVMTRGTRFEKVGTYSNKNLDTLCDNVEALWVNGYDSFNGKNNRIPRNIAMGLRSSLLCIKPEDFWIDVQAELDLRRVRAKFTYRNVPYCCLIADKQLEEEFKHEDEGEYQFSRKNPIIGIKLGDLYKEFCYKIMTGVIF